MSKCYNSYSGSHDTLANTTVISSGLPPEMIPYLPLCTNKSITYTCICTGTFHYALINVFFNYTGN